MMTVRSSGSLIRSRMARAARRSVGHGAVLAVAALAVGVFLLPGAAQAAPAGLSAADVAALTGVRQACLMEIAAGKLAATKGNQPPVRQIGAQIANRHVRLDQTVTQAANQLGVKLPTQVSAEEQSWLVRMQGSPSQPQFDQMFVSRVRAADGKLQAAISTVRAGSRNDVVRRMAQAADQEVQNDTALLASTGLVVSADLPSVAQPQPPAGPAAVIQRDALARASTADGFSLAAVWIVLLGGLLAGGAGGYRLLRPKVVRR
jgi:predicted outer membrane protein